MRDNKFLVKFMSSGGFGRGAGRGLGRRVGPPGDCICPRCGYRTAHMPGMPCRQQLCPRCGTPMMRA
ncbi:MAG: hypothetical protein DRJ98_01950 [Thermoprotei archaeon]|nr:MAG: hypothetical protein DRJ98_01950 [Thermoprotei archaeon]RLF18769.1 MAG: hypothetical protein DRN06_00600 [Thermoprotei archaeon]